MFNGLSGVKLPCQSLVVLCVFLVATTVISGPAEAAKLYKIVDEKTGKVTFSQFPPTENKDKVKVDSLKVASGGMSARKENGRVLCGDMVLSDYLSKKKRVSDSAVVHLGDKIRYWQDELSRIDQRQRHVDSYQSRVSDSRYANRESHVNKSKRYDWYLGAKTKGARRAVELDCAIDWARDRIAVLKSGKNDDPSQEMNERNRLNQLQEKHKYAMIEQCGDEPPFDPTTAQGKQLTKDWKACMKPFKKDIRAIKHRILGLES